MRAWFLACAAGCWALAAPAADVPAALQQQAGAALQRALAQELPALDPQQVRVQWQAPRGAALQGCPTGWSVETPRLRQLRRVTFALHCGPARGSLVAQVSVQREAWALRQERPAGHALADADLQRSPVWMESLEPLPEAWALRGAQLRRTLPAASVLRARDLLQPIVLRRGDKVEIRASAEGVTVGAQGTALAAGGLGQHVRVRNARSNQVIEGVIVAPGVVQAGERQPGAGGVKVLPQSRD